MHLSVLNRHLALLQTMQQFYKKDKILICFSRNGSVGLTAGSVDITKYLFFFLNEFIGLTAGNVNITETLF